MVFVLYFSDKDVKRKLLAQVAQAARPLWVVQVRHDRHARPPEEREPFVTLERQFGDVVDTVLVADEGSTEGMWRDPVGDLADGLFPDDRQQAYRAASGYLLLDARGRPLSVVKKSSAATDLWFLQEAMAAHLPGVPPPDPAAKPGRKQQVHARRPHASQAHQQPPRADARRAHAQRTAWGRWAQSQAAWEHEEEPEPAAAPAPAETMASEDPWQVLGVPPGTPLTEAKKAYRALVAQYHPDKVSHLAPEFRELADRRTRQILEAWRRIEEGEVA